MEEILDQTFNEKEKDETQANRLTAAIRIFLCGYMLITKFKFLYGSLTFQSIRQRDIPYLSFLIFDFFIFLLFVYYNFRHGKLELQSKYVIPVFKRFFILLFFLYCLYILLGCLPVISTGIGYFLNEKVLFSPAYYLGSLIVGGITLVLILWIFYREIIYFRRISKPQSITNQ